MLLLEAFRHPIRVTCVSAMISTSTVPSSSSFDPRARVPPAPHFPNKGLRLVLLPGIHPFKPSSMEGAADTPRRLRDLASEIERSQKGERGMSVRPSRANGNADEPTLMPAVAAPRRAA